MKFSKYIISFFLSCFFSDKVKSQFAIAGIPGSIYADIVPDTLLSPTAHSTSSFPPDDIYYIDVNQDGSNDIKIDANYYFALGGDGASINVTMVNSSTAVSYGRTDSTYNGYQHYWITRNILKLYSNLDTVKNAIYKSQSYLGYYYHQNGATASSSEWENQGDKFFGVRYIGISDTSYGWVKVNVSGPSNCLIKEFSLYATPVNIDLVLDFESINIFPNPATAKINIRSSSELKTITIYNTLGGIALQIQSKNKTEQLDVTNLTDGIYFLEVKTGKGGTTKKIVIQH